jgi:hypothetical protein
MYNLYLIDDKKNIVNVNGKIVGYFDLDGNLHDNSNKFLDFRIGKYGKVFDNEENVVGSLENKVLCFLKQYDPYGLVDEKISMSDYESLEFDNPYLEKRTVKIQEILDSFDNYDRKPFEITKDKIKIDLSEPTEAEEILKSLLEKKYNEDPLEIFKPQEFDNPYNLSEDAEYYDPIIEFKESKK